MGWWHGAPGFAAYAGPRPGFVYAPAYGYYRPAPAYARTVWVVGMTLPPPLRRYVVRQPAAFGLAPPRPGLVWCAAGTNFVLVTRRGVILQSVAGGW